jgi:hypothetical protein
VPAAAARACGTAGSTINAVCLLLCVRLRCLPAPPCSFAAVAGGAVLGRAVQLAFRALVAPPIGFGGGQGGGADGGGGGGGDDGAANRDPEDDAKMDSKDVTKIKEEASKWIFQCAGVSGAWLTARTDATDNLPARSNSQN